MPEDRLVTVVIPTTGRATAERSLASARAQVDVPVEVIVVWDGKTPLAEDSVLHRLADRVISTGGQGGGHARNQGVLHGSGNYVAFLDDDDVWLPDKLRSQLDALDSVENPLRTLASHRVELRWEDDKTKAGLVTPASTIPMKATVSDYLFRGRGIERTRNALFTSTFLLDRATAMEIPWDPSLARHQDWDWVIRLQKHGVDILQLEDVLSHQMVGSTDSVSARDDWQASLSWFRHAGHSWHARTRADFLVGQALRFALQARDFEGVKSVLRHLGNTGIPSARTVLLALASLLPRRTLVRIAKSFRRGGV